MKKIRIGNDITLSIPLSRLTSTQVAALTFKVFAIESDKEEASAGVMFLNAHEHHHEHKHMAEMATSISGNNLIAVWKVDDQKLGKYDVVVSAENSAGNKAAGDVVSAIELVKHTKDEADDDDTLISASTTVTLPTITLNLVTVSVGSAKPSGGWKKADLASDVQTSLGKADSALQSHQDISGKQDVISDLATIRSGAAKGATSLQDSDLDYTINGHRAVDLGITLTNGKHLLWAACNIGATTPEGYGKYFQWGDTVGYEGDEAKAHSTWSTCPYQTKVTEVYSSTRFTKYLGSTTSPYKDSSATDEDALKTVLDAEDDAAHVIMGGNWRMPTKAENDALLALSSTWTTQNGVNGRTFTGNGNTIFLPAAGFFSEGELCNEGFAAPLRSSTIYVGAPYNAFYLSCTSARYYNNYSDREQSKPVRGVIELTDDELKAAKKKLYTKSEVDTIASGKVDKVSGKGLSTNDYTNTDKAKVAAALTEHQSLAAYAKKTEIPTSLAALDSTAASQLTKVGSEIGTLNDLQTTAKSNLVAAINELKEQGGGIDTNSEQVIIMLSCNDGGITFENYSVVLTEAGDDGIVHTVELDETGEAIAYIKKGVTYTISFPSIDGYNTLSDQTYTAEHYVRNITGHYLKQGSILTLATGITVEASNPDISATRDGNLDIIDRILSHGAYVIDETHKKYARLSETNHAKFADGTGYNGTYGNCFRYLPKVWIKQGDDAKHFYVSDLDISEVSLPESWIGVYKGSLQNGKLVSRPRVETTQSRTMSQFWQDAQSNGTNYGLVNYFDFCKYNLLHLVKFGQHNSELTMGEGLQNAGSNYYKHITGTTEALGNGTGSATYDGSYSMNKLFGIEGLAGATWEFRPNIRFDSSRAYIYEGNIVSNDAAAIRSFLCNRNLSGSYSVNMELGAYFDIIPLVGGGSSNTYWCDGGWASTSGQLLVVGGDSSNGSLGGLSATLSTAAFSSSNTSLGARLAFKGSISEYELVSGEELASLNS